MALRKKAASIKHPEPGIDFSKTALPIKVLKSDLFRIHRSDLNAKFFGRTLKNRFDASDCSYGVMYLGLDEYCCFIETFGQQTGDNFVTIEELSVNSLASIKLSRELRLVDISGAGLARVGADNRLTTGAHALSRRWSRAFHDHRDYVDGIYFRACHDPDRSSIALFERAQNSIIVTKSIKLLSPDVAFILTDILDKYNFALG